MAMPDADDIAAIYSLLGFDPETTQTVILQPDSVVGIATDSIPPARMRSTITAVVTRSPRNFGKNTPRDVAPTW